MVELGEPLGVEGGEGQVLELLLDLLHPQPVGEGGVDVEGLLGDASLLLQRHRRDRPHVVQPIGELDDQDPQVAGHRDEHLAHRRRLLGLARVELDPFQLGDAVDDRGDLLAEPAFDVGERDLGVLDRVVEQRGGDGDLVESDVGHDARHGEGVVDVALAAGPELAAVRLGGHFVGPADRGDRRLRVAAAVAGEQRGQLDRCRGLVVPPPRENAVDGAHRIAQYVASASSRRSPSLSPTAQLAELDQDADPDDRPAERLDQAARGGGRAAGGEHVVDDEDALVGMDRVTVDLESVAAVLQLVLLADDRPRQLAGLAHRDEGGAEAIRHRSGEDEAARLDADDPVDVVGREALGQFVDRPAEAVGVAEQRRDVAEGDSRLGVVRDVAHEGAEPDRFGHRRRGRPLGGHRPRLPGSSAPLLLTRAGRVAEHLGARRGGRHRRRRRRLAGCRPFGRRRAAPPARRAHRGGAAHDDGPEVVADQVRVDGPVPPGELRFLALQPAEQRGGDEQRRVGADGEADEAGRWRTPAASPGRGARRPPGAATPPAAQPRCWCSAIATAPGSPTRSRRRRPRDQPAASRRSFSLTRSNTTIVSYSE